MFSAKNYKSVNQESSLIKNLIFINFEIYSVIFPYVYEIRFLFLTLFIVFFIGLLLGIKNTSWLLIKGAIEFKIIYFVFSLLFSALFLTISCVIISKFFVSLKKIRVMGCFLSFFVFTNRQKPTIWPFWIPSINSDYECIKTIKNH